MEYIIYITDKDGAEWQYNVSASSIEVATDVAVDEHEERGLTTASIYVDVSS